MIWDNVKTVLDIFMVALMIYRVLVLMVGTRAIQLVKGILMLLTGAVIASMLKLRLLSWLFSRAFLAFSIIIPIVFQPELRKMLEEIGRGNLWHRAMPQDEAKQRVQHIVNALRYMKEKYIGALLVLQQETNLGEYWMAGVRLDANISEELLISIFWKNNPLHDGAVIMDRDKLIAGACTNLPDTDDPEISRWFGTRHRAAIGLSQVSDALVLVVSEERGEVSLAYKGYLTKNMKDSQVEKLLMHYFIGEQASTNWWEGIKSILWAQN